MRMLAVDTASRSCSVAVITGASLVAETSFESHRTHARHLLTMISGVLSLADMEAHDLDALAVTTGPGSFTGLRIGISTLQGFAAALSIPLVGLSTLDVLAWQAVPTPYPICAMIDARRGEVYCRWYRCRGDEPHEQGRGCVTTPAALVAGLTRDALFIGSGTLAHRDFWAQHLDGHVHLAPEAGHRIRATTLAAMAVGHLGSASVPELTDLKPVYFRKSDAELKLGKIKRVIN